MDPELRSLGVELAASAVRNTASAVAGRIRAVKAKRQDRDTIAELEEIVNDLIADKNELLRIAQAFEQELVAQRISQEDIEYITGNMVPIIRELAEAGSSDPGQEDAMRQMIELLTPIVSVETVTVLQLIGFNYKEALGQPLTELVASLIGANARVTTEGQEQLQRLVLQREIAMLELAGDAEAFARWQSLGGQS